MTTTYLTVRQSMKRGMMPTGKDNPMGQSQKLMAYVMPLFALTGLYWQFGLVLYWVTTNLWTLGQQYVLLRKYPVGAAAMAADGNVPIGGPKPATAPGLTGRQTKPRTSGGAKPAGNKPVSTTKPAASAADGSANGHKPSEGDGGMLRRFSRKAEPEPPPAPEPQTKIVRQQRTRQSRSKRSGKR
jgi:YidC/Oxa1 family membrane protein insertase